MSDISHVRRVRLKKSSKKDCNDLSGAHKRPETEKF